MYCNSYRKCQWRLKSKWSSQTTCLRMKEPVTLLTFKYCFQMHCLAYLISTLIRIVIVNIVPSLSFSYSKNIHKLTINIQIAEETFKVLINEIDNKLFYLLFNILILMIQIFSKMLYFVLHTGYVNSDSDCCSKDFYIASVIYDLLMQSQIPSFPHESQKKAFLKKYFTWHQNAPCVNLDILIK